MSLPRVSIVILAYLESNRAYFEACWSSVKNLNYPKELLDIVIVSPWLKEVSGAKVVRNYARPDSFSGSTNTGIDHTDPDSKLILLLSDDTMIARESLMNMVLAADEADVVLAALSNCDNYWKYHLHLPYVYPERYYRLEHLNADMIKAMQNASSMYPPGIIFTDTLCFYAFLIPRKTWDKVGELDEGYNMGFEDSDYCARARLKGVRLAICMNAIIWHAGGASAEIITEGMREGNKKRFAEKWQDG